MHPSISITTVSPQQGLAIRERVPNAQIGPRMGEFFGELAAYLGRQRLTMTGPPFAIYHEYNMESTDMEAGFPVSGMPAGEGRIKPCMLPGGKVVTATHVGPYDKLMDTYNLMMKWMAENGHVPKQLMWESYLSDPDVVKDPDKYVTQIFWPIE